MPQETASAPHPAPPARPVLVALGANAPSSAGPPEATLRAALAALDGPGLRCRAVSRAWRTPCFPPGAGPDFVNAAAVFASDAAPAALLARLHRVEALFGRRRPVAAEAGSARWQPRPLDLDLIAVGAALCPDAAGEARWRALRPGVQRRLAPRRLVLPHPRLHERAFVLVPLAEVAPGWCHPATGLSVAQMCAALPAEARAEMAPLDYALAPDPAP